MASLKLTQENDSMSLTVFANFKIDSEERLQRMKDSFESFKDAEINQWVINARGHYKDDAIQYLKDRLGEKLISLYLESKEGWFSDSRKMIGVIKYDYIFFWIEDHICMCGTEKLDAIVSEMKRSDVEYLGYSWFGMGRSLNQFKGINGTDGNEITSYNYSKKINKIRQNNSLNEIGEKSYIISACGIFSRALFIKILMQKRPFLPRWPRETPFDFEKRWDDTYILSICYGVSKYEIFASIDDDNLYKGSSLFSRGLYPKRVNRLDMISIREIPNKRNNILYLRKIFSKYTVFRIFYKYIIRITYLF